MPWKVTVDFNDDRERQEGVVPGEPGLAMGVEAALGQAGIALEKPNYVDKNGFQITIYPVS